MDRFARVSAAQSSELVQAIADANARLLLFKEKSARRIWQGLCTVQTFSARS
jgi:hypothetical protein